MECVMYRSACSKAGATVGIQQKAPHRAMLFMFVNEHNIWKISVEFGCYYKTQL